jgi:phosphatidylserine decarboxylase
MTLSQHQFVDRESGKICTERLFGDQAVQMLYSAAMEKAPVVFRALTSARTSRFLATVVYNSWLDRWVKGLTRASGIDFSECLTPEELTTPRSIFQRKIRYWEYRPMTEKRDAIVSPADSRVVFGSLSHTSGLFVKEKFFDLDELLGADKRAWINAFSQGDYAIFRLTPEKYHYNHTPVAGQVVDIYEIQGSYHSCNPGAVVTMVTPFSKNKRVVTIIDTDSPGGTGIGLVAMIEVVALMIGDIVQAYSEARYENPRTVTTGMFLLKGCPKSLYKPGSSTDIILFQKDRIEFSEDLRRNLVLSGVRSRFSKGFGQPLVETDLRVRSIIGSAKTGIHSKRLVTLA